MAQDEDKPQLDVPPASQVDLKERLARDHASTSTVTGPLDENADDHVNPLKVHAPFATEDTDTSAYIGVSTEYMTHAEVANQPFPFSEGVEAESVESMLDHQFAVGKDVTSEGEHTLGGGSSVEPIYTHVSGEDLQPEVVDREAVQKEVRERADKVAKGEDGGSVVTSSMGDGDVTPSSAKDDSDSSSKSTSGSKSTSASAPAPTKPKSSTDK